MAVDLTWCFLMKTVVAVVGNADAAAEHSFGDVIGDLPVVVRVDAPAARPGRRRRNPRLGLDDVVHGAAASGRRVVAVRAAGRLLRRRGLLRLHGIEPLIRIPSIHSLFVLLEFP